MCNPTSDQIPKVDAIMVVHGKAVGRGRRGTGRLGDNEHAEWNALERVKDRSQLPDSTLYTTPCIGEARSEPLKSCTEQIILHRNPRAAIGILDPSPAVTGKGLWRLQDTGVEVMLFPHELAHKIRAIKVQNA